MKQQSGRIRSLGHNGSNIRLEMIRGEAKKTATTRPDISVITNVWYFCTCISPSCQPLPVSFFYFFLSGVSRTRGIKDLRYTTTIERSITSHMKENKACCRLSGYSRRKPIDLSFDYCSCVYSHRPPLGPAYRVETAQLVLVPLRAKQVLNCKPNRNPFKKKMRKNTKKGCASVLCLGWCNPRSNHASRISFVDFLD